MAETTFVTVTWTAGDIATEAKMDNMTANDNAVDAMEQGVRFVERADPDDADVGGNNMFLYAKDKSGVSTLYLKNDGNTVYEVSEGRPTFERAIPGSVFVGTSLTPLIGVHRTLTIVKAYAYVKTAPTGADLIIDINKNATSIWNATQANRLTVSATATSGTQTAFDTTTLAEGDTLTVDIDQVGSTVTGADILIQLRCK